MDFRVLGGLEVTGDRQAGPPPGVKERAILARLLVDPGRPVSADALIEAAWGQVPREAAARSLSVRIANLRAFLEPDRSKGAPPLILQRDRAGYKLAIDPEQVDAQRFEEGVRYAATLEPAAAVDAYDEALELWQGEPFADISYASFAQAEIERLGELRRQAVEGRAQALIELGRPGDAAAELRRLVAEDPLREELVRTLMTALYASGRQVDALAAYRDLSERLSEVGLQPGRETRELERRILVQDPSLRSGAPEEPAEAPEPAESPEVAESAEADATPVRGGPVDRDAELRTLRTALARALAGRRGVVAVCGEPGVGKTTLVEAFAHEATEREGVLVTTGQCVEHRGPGEPYLPVLEAISTLASGADKDRVVTELARRAPTWLNELPWLLDADDMESLRQRILGATRERMLREMTEALEALAVERPIVMVLEDLHWADPSTLDLIGAIARRRRPARLLILVTYQPADESAGAQKLVHDLALRASCTEIQLTRLDAVGVTAYLMERFPGTQAADRLGRMLAKRSGGNPLFMRHLVDHWEQHGVVSPGGAVTVPPEELPTGVPATLRAYIDEQLATLDADDRELLVATAVAGRSASPELVADAVGRREAEVRAAMTRIARTAGMIESLGDGFRFSHDLYREVLYDSADSDRRAVLHRRIGAFLEDSLGSNVRDLAGELAHHFVAGGDAAGAARFLRVAGERAFARNAYPEGVRHVRAALAAAARLPDGTARTRAQVELLSLLGQALVAIGGWSSPEAEEALQRARTRAGRLRDNEPLVTVLLALATLYEVRGELGKAKEVAEQYLVHNAEEPAARRLQAEELLACNLFHQGAFARALEHAELGLELFEGEGGAPLAGHYSTFPATIGDNAGVACHDWAGLALWYLGHPDQALERARSALVLADDPGRSYSLASARAQLAVIHQCRQEPAETLEWAEATIAAAEERGYAYRVAMGRVLRGWAVAALGDSEAGVEEIVRGMRASRATGARMDEPHYLGLLADAYLRADEVQAAAGAIDEALEISVRERSLFYEPELLRLRAAALMRADGDESAAQAEAALREAVDIARHQASRSLELRVATALVRVCRERGRGSEARAALATVFESFDEGFSSHDLRAAAELLGRETTPV
jgi:DNA-binding SARP family transcriptional activator